MKTLIALLLIVTSSQVMANLPVKIVTHKLRVESISGTMTYDPVVSTCEAITRDYKGLKLNENEVKINLKRTITGKCGLYRFNSGDFTMKLEGQSNLQFKISKGKLMNDYATSWAHIYWGAWVDSSCVFREGKYLSCDAGSDSSSSRVDRPFTLYISPLYPMFQWNIVENIR